LQVTKIKGEVPLTTANLADQCARVVMETVPQVMRAIREEMRRQGAPLLSLPQLRTLAYLHRNPGSCLFHLAKHLGVARPTASTIVERLVRRGMVTRADNPEERRRVVLTLTPLGARYLRRARESTQSWMATALSRLSSARLRRIMQGMSLLGEPFAGGASENGHE
jgi:DNA-binding MarR family transcriptional regulator